MELSFLLYGDYYYFPFSIRTQNILISIPFPQYSIPKVYLRNSNSLEH